MVKGKVHKLGKMHFRVTERWTSPRGTACGRTQGDNCGYGTAMTTVRDQVTCEPCRRSMKFRLSLGAVVEQAIKAGAP